MPEISIVIPVYNEEESIENLFTELASVLRVLSKEHEIIFVNDCSDDSSPEKLKILKEKFPQIVKCVDLERRSGQTFALKKGLEAAAGDIVVTLDADLQNDPADIPKMLEKMKEGYDCVCGWRKSRQDTFLKARLSKAGNFLQRSLTGLRIHDVSCTLRAYRKECVAKIPLNWEGQHRFIPLCLSLQGYQVGEIVSHHRKRIYGDSKYTHKRIFRVISDFFRILFVRGKR